MKVKVNKNSDIFPKRLSASDSSRKVVLKHNPAAESRSHCRNLQREVDIYKQTDFNIALRDDCWISNDHDDDWLYYHFEFNLLPESRTQTARNSKDEEVIITDWGTAWIATCKYDRVKQVGQGIVSWQSDIKKHKGGINHDVDIANEGEDLEQGEFKVKLDIYSDESYSRAYTQADYPLEYAMKTRVYNQISFIERTHREWLNLVTLGCWALPELDSTHRWDLISDKCVDDPGLMRFEENYNRYVDRFSFRSFKFPGEQPNVFVQCEVLICNSKNYDNENCSRSCPNDPFGTRARSNSQSTVSPGLNFRQTKTRSALVRNDLNTQIVTAGPFKMVEANESAATEFSAQSDAAEATGFWDYAAYALGAAGLCAVGVIGTLMKFSFFDTASDRKGLIQMQDL